MTLSLGLFLLSYLCISLACVFLSIKIFLRHRYRFLLYFFLFLSLGYLSYFLDVLSYHFTLGLLKRLSSDSDVFQLLSVVFSGMAVPFFAVSTFFFILMVMEIRSGNVSVKQSVGFWVFETIFIVGIFIAVILYSTSGNDFFVQLLHILNNILRSVNYLFLLLLLGSLMIFLKQSPDNGMNNILKTFSILYVCMFLLRVSLFLIVGYKTFSCYIQPFIVYCMHFPPLVFLFLKMGRENSVSHLSQTKPSLDLDFCRKYNITDREQEIIKLLIEGKSNREIEDTLFISIKTVKTHIYNIYKKLGINRRYQLIKMLQETG